MIDRYKLIQQLQSGVATVVFEKANGETREMQCTLEAQYLPQEPQLLQEGETKKVRAQNPDVLPVWDLESNGWRSFRLDSVKSINGVPVEAS